MSHFQNIGAPRRHNSTPATAEPSLLNINYQVNKAVKSMLYAFQSAAPADHLDEIIAKAIDSFDDSIKRLQPDSKNGHSLKLNSSTSRLSREPLGLGLIAVDEALAGIEKVFDRLSEGIVPPLPKRRRGKSFKEDKSNSVSKDDANSNLKRAREQPPRKDREKKQKKGNKRPKIESEHFSTPKSEITHNQGLPTVVNPSPRPAHDLADDMVAASKNKAFPVSSRDPGSLIPPLHIHNPVTTPSVDLRIARPAILAPQTASTDVFTRYSWPQRIPRLERGIQI